MAEAAIPVDLFNPGQVFACLGLVEAAEMLLGDAEGAFDWRDPATTTFRLRANGEIDPVAEVLRFLGEAEVVALLPEGLEIEPKWKVDAERTTPSDVFPGPTPKNAAAVPIALRSGAREIIIDHWADGSQSRDTAKFWAGMQGKPGAAVAQDALNLLLEQPHNVAGDPFGFRAPQSSSFRFDWRRDYVPLDAGFSLNEHKNSMITIGYPIVELLAALGMSNARPERPDPRNRLEYRYAAPGTANGALYPPVLMRAALGAGPVFVPGLPLRRFRMFLNWPGQEGQARAITDVVEETEA